MNCECCGTKIGGIFGKKGVTIKSTEHICKDCLASWGFTEEDLKSDRYKLKSWLFLKRGKTECDAIIDRDEYIKTHTKEYKTNLGDVCDPKIQKYLEKTAKDQTDPEDLYGGWTIASLKREGNEYQHTIFGGIDFDCELKKENGMLGVYFEGTRVAETKYTDIFEKDHDSFLIINGGKYRKVEDGENVSGETPMWLMLKIVYVE